MDNLRVHLIAWHPDIATPSLWKKDLTKGIRKLSGKPRWAERLNKRQKELREQGKLPPTPDDWTCVEEESHEGIKKPMHTVTQDTKAGYLGCDQCDFSPSDEKELKAHKKNLHQIPKTTGKLPSDTKATGKTSP